MDDKVRIYGKINLDHGLRTTEFSLGMKKKKLLGTSGLCQGSKLN